MELSAESTGTAPGRGRLTGRRILVVGGGTRHSDDPDAPLGNGRAVCVLAAREGAHVLVADRDVEAAQGTADLVAAAGGKADVLVGDVADEDVCERMPVDAAAAMGGLDGIVLNVGIGAGAGLGGTSAAEWDAVVAVNLRAHFLVTKAAAAVLEPGSSVVFVGSAAGLRPGTNVPAYDATKAGLAGLMRHVALELAPDRRANLLVPGLIDTPLGRFATAGRPSRAAAPVPLARQGTAWEVAYPAVWLLSHESAYVTGQSLVVDGGLTFA